MQKLHFTIQIQAPKEKVWDTMLQDATYREWTKPFNDGSRYEGSWDVGAEIKFVGSDEEGNEYGGMYAKIRENRLHEFISIEHLGLIGLDGSVDTTSDEVKKWTPAFENYTFKEISGAESDSEFAGGTELSVDVDTNEEYKEMFEGTWPKALLVLKELAEK
ncbi:MAG: hypothetical protein QG568_240 [Patescibacteria group bacterium]|nr:hypothetical protein [Patescibacteria group bacterium]